MSAPHIVLAYLSPETILPLTSIVAAIAGGSMFITRRSIRLIGRCFRVAFRRPRRSATPVKTHFPSRDGVLAP